MKSKDNKSKKKPIGIVITIIIFILVALVAGIMLCIFSVIKEEDADKEESFYFMFYDFSENNFGTVLYYYDSETGNVSEYDRFEGYGSATIQINDERTVLIGRLKKRGEIPADDEYYFIRYWIENKEVELISYSEIEERFGLEMGRMFPSDNGECIYFAGSKDGEKYDLYQYDWTTNDVVLFSKIPENSIDEKIIENQIYYICIKTGDIYVYDIESGQKTRILECENSANDLAVSADGSKILFYDYSYEQYFYRYYVYVYDITTQDLKCVGEELYVEDIGWIGDYYAYEMLHYGIIDTCDPAIKVGSIESENKKIYRQNGIWNAPFEFIYNY